MATGSAGARTVTTTARTPSSRSHHTKPDSPKSERPRATSVIELSISCRNLRDRDVFSKSDPQCILYVREFGGGRWTEFGRTELIYNTLSPDFVKKFVVKYHFERSQALKFEIFDIDGSSPYLCDHDYLGRHECTLGEVVSAGVVRAKLGGCARYNSGTITIKAEEVSECKTEVTLQFLGRKLERKTLIGYSDPFLVFRRCESDGSFTAVHRTEFLKKTQNPTWAPFTISLKSLCNADWDRALKVQCYDWSKNGSHLFIGKFHTTARDLSVGPGPHNTYELINDRKKGKKPNYVNSGEIHLISFSQDNKHTFLDFVRAGTEIVCSFAIDFSDSNADPKKPVSLHKSHNGIPSPYARAIRAVGDVIEDYNRDHMFAVLGFGARVASSSQSQFFHTASVPRSSLLLVHLIQIGPFGAFPQNGTDDPHCQGIDGVLRSYESCIERVTKSGMPKLAPVIRHAACAAAAHRDGSKYRILIVLTNGLIDDLARTKEAIVKASSCPLSIVIVGIGSANFASMDILDGDSKRVSYRGIPAERDIVQFVPFREFDETVNPARSGAYLAEAVLDEIPAQFLSYMRANVIHPRPATAPEPECCTP